MLGQRIFELSLGDLVEDFLGEGPWVPDPKRWMDEQDNHHVVVTEAGAAGEA